MIQQSLQQPNITRTLLDRALVETAEQYRTGDAAEMITRLRNGDCTACDCVRLNLARQVAQYLGEANPQLCAIYWYDPAAAFENYERERTGVSESSGINLFAVTADGESDLAAQIEALRTEVRQARTDLLCAKACDLCFTLNIAMVNQADVKARHGYAALIDSQWVRPLQVWSRE